MAATLSSCWSAESTRRAHSPKTAPVPASVSKNSWCSSAAANCRGAPRAPTREQECKRGAKAWQRLPAEQVKRPNHRAHFGGARTYAMAPKDRQYLRQQSRPQHAQPELDEEEACARRRGRSQWLAHHTSSSRPSHGQTTQRGILRTRVRYRRKSNMIAGQDDDDHRNERFAADAVDSTYRTRRRYLLAMWKHR